MSVTSADTDLEGHGVSVASEGIAIEFRFEVEVVRGEAGRHVRLVQAHALRDLLSWVHDRQSVPPAAQRICTSNDRGPPAPNGGTAEQ